MINDQVKMLGESLQKKWGPVINHPDLPVIEDAHKRAVTAVLLENQEMSLREQAAGSRFLAEGPTNSFGPSAGFGGGAGVPSGAGGNAANPFAYVDPVLISMVRRSAPNLMAYDVCGVQPMTGPSGLIFAMRSRYEGQNGAEALYQEANPNFSGDTTAAPGGDYSNQNFLYDLGYGVQGSEGPGTSTDTLFQPTDAAGHAVNTNPLFGAAGDSQEASAFTSSGAGNLLQDSESLGYGTGDYRRTDAAGNPIADSNLGAGAPGNHFREMAFTIERVVVEAKTRALKGEYSMELQQDLRAVHGLDAETELANIISTEIMAEINREIMRTIYWIAVRGAQHGTRTRGRFNLDFDGNGRWAVERWKGLMFQMEREANQLAKDTRRGKGNFIITSADVASALQMAGVLDYSSALPKSSLNVDDTGNTFAGMLNGRYKVYVDPYAGNIGTGAGSQNFFVMGYKGSSAYDAGLFYCPYVPLQMVRAIGEDTFQPKVGFKTRYGLVANPFAEGYEQGYGRLRANSNQYYRGVVIENIF